MRGNCCCSHSCSQLLATRKSLANHGVGTDCSHLINSGTNTHIFCVPQNLGNTGVHAFWLKRMELDCSRWLATGLATHRSEQPPRENIFETAGKLPPESVLKLLLYMRSERSIWVYTNLDERSTWNNST